MLKRKGKCRKMKQTILNKPEDKCPNCGYYNERETGWQPNNREILNNYKCFNCRCKWDARIEYRKDEKGVAE